MSRYLNPGTSVRLVNHGDGSWEDGVVIHCWLDEEIGSFDCYVAFIGDAIPAGKPLKKPYVLRYASASLKIIERDSGRTADAYVYVATGQGVSESYVDLSQSLLGMEWIAKYGVDDLVWFEGHADYNNATQRAAELRVMTESERRELVRRHNPEQLDLSSRIWGSDPD